MKDCSLFLLFAILFFSGCRKTEEQLPGCIQSKIEVFNGNSCEQGAKVDQYIFQGQAVFVFVLGNCGADLPAEVIDKNCNHLGTLGGFLGNTRINNEEFSNAKHVRTVWRR